MYSNQGLPARAFPIMNVASILKSNLSRIEELIIPFTETPPRIANSFFTEKSHWTLFWIPPKRPFCFYLPYQDRYFWSFKIMHTALSFRHYATFGGPYKRMNSVHFGSFTAAFPIWLQYWIILISPLANLISSFTWLDLFEADITASTIIITATMPTIIVIKLILFIFFSEFSQSNRGSSLIHLCLHFPQKHINVCQKYYFRVKVKGGLKDHSAFFDSYKY